MSASDRAPAEDGPPNVRASHISHAANCVCASCLACHSLGGALVAERLRSDSIMRLDTYQRRLLHTFTLRWNADRAHRGLSPVLAHDALTQGLESLIAMIGQE